MSTKRHIFEFIVGHDLQWHSPLKRSHVRKMFGGASDDVDLHLEQLEREGLLNLGQSDDDPILLPRIFQETARIGLRNGVRSESRFSECPSGRSAITVDLNNAGFMMQGDLFAQVVEDDSMSDAGISRGDVAILKASHPNRGEIVAVAVDDHLVLRRYVVVSGIPHFLAENPNRPNLIMAHEQTIHGVLCCLISTNPSGRGANAAPVKAISYQNDGGLFGKAEILKMLKPAPKARKTSAEKMALGVAPQVPRKGTRRAWPDPMSGFSCNDSARKAYQTGPERLICDEQPDKKYGSAYLDAIARFVAEQEIEERSNRSNATVDVDVKSTGAICGDARKGRKIKPPARRTSTTAEKPKSKNEVSFLRV